VEQEMELAMFRSVNSGIPMEWQGQLQHLRELGFSYEDSVQCMQATHGDMAKTVDLLMARQAEQEQNLGTTCQHS